MNLELSKLLRENSYPGRGIAVSYTHLQIQGLAGLATSLKEVMTDVQNPQS